jgi:branched-chain amino acid transport system substrate-binding protein
MEMRRLFAALAVLGLVAALLTPASAASKSPYVIGAIFDVTGPGAPLGTPEQDTVKMIEAQVNRAGGINGHPVKFVIYDNGSEETRCVMAAKKLIETDKVKAIVGPSTTGTTLAIASICQKAGIPLVSCAAGIKITQPVTPYVFKTAQSDAHAVAKVIDYLRAQRIKQVAFIHVSNAFGNSGREQMEAQAPRAGLNLVATESFGDKDTDVTAQLTRIKAKNPQAVVCWGTNPGPAIVARKMKELGLRMPLVMSHGIANRKFIDLAGDAANGVVFPAGRLIVANAIASSDPQKRNLTAYTADFRKFCRRDPDHFGGHAWDAAQMILAALRKVGDDPKKIRAELENTRNFVGISGIFNYSPPDHNGLTKGAFVMVRIQNGKWTLLK